MTVKSSYKQCEHCGTRLLIVRGVPALNYGRDPAGKVAVTITDPRKGRFLAHDEQPGPLEHQHSVHECDGMKRAAQRGNWAATQARQRRRQRTQRARRTQVQPYLGYTAPPGRNS